MKKSLLLLGFVIYLTLGISVVVGAGGTAEFHEINGEVISIDDSSIFLYQEGVYFKLKLAPEVKIYCNGISEYWKALQPITPNAFYDARVILNQRNQVVFLEGLYQGEECIIQGWQEVKQQLYLKLVAINDHQFKQRLVKEDAVLPNANWLITGQLVYVLYQRDGRIRGVYLPD